MPRYCDITVTLDDAAPPVWRRFLLTADPTFADLHRAIQDACGWQNYHLFAFSSAAGGRIAGLPDPDWDDEGVPDASTVTLSPAFGERCVVHYVYDFGGHWEHTVRSEGVVKSDEHFHPRLLDGARAFPPEDCGGVSGYEHCVEVARGGEDDEGLREWLGGWEPERFDLEAARAAARGSGRVGRTAAGQRGDDHAVELAVVASVRHRDTDYDALLMARVPRDEARRRVREDVDVVLERWRTG